MIKQIQKISKFLSRRYLYDFHLCIFGVRNNYTLLYCNFYLCPFQFNPSPIVRFGVCHQGSRHLGQEHLGHRNLDHRKLGQILISATDIWAKNKFQPQAFRPITQFSYRHLGKTPLLATDTLAKHTSRTLGLFSQKKLSHIQFGYWIILATDISAIRTFWPQTFRPQGYF